MAGREHRRFRPETTPQRIPSVPRRPGGGGTSGPVANVLAFQRLAGNRALTKFLERRSAVASPAVAPFNSTLDDQDAENSPDTSRPDELEPKRAAPESSPHAPPERSRTANAAGLRGWVQRVAARTRPLLRAGLTLQRCTKAPSREEMLRDVELTDNDQYVRDVFDMFYPGMAPEQITPALQDLAARMLWAAIQASRQMDLVPRPTLNPTASWLLRQGVQAAFRYGRDRGLYRAVVVTVARNFRSEYELTREGVMH